MGAGASHKVVDWVGDSSATDCVALLFWCLVQSSVLTVLSLLLRPSAAVGNVRYSLSNVTFTCSTEPAAIETTAESIPLAADSGSVIAGSCGELVYYLGVGSVTDIEMAGRQRVCQSVGEGRAR